MMTKFATISVNRLAELDMQGSVEVIDVRTPMEFREVHAAIARNYPLDALDPAAIMRRRAKQEQPLYIICRSGNRSGKACQ